MGGRPSHGNDRVHEKVCSPASNGLGESSKDIFSLHKTNIACVSVILNLSGCR